MPSTDALGAWSNFYVIVGSAAAALTGLMFVVVTLLGGRPSASAASGIKTFGSPTVLHFCIVLLTSLALTAPWPSPAAAGVVVGAGGLYGAIYSLRGARGMLRLHRRDTSYTPVVEDWTWYVALPLLAYGALVIAAGALVRIAGSHGALTTIAASASALIFVGIHNAWDIVTFIAVRDPDGDGADGG